MVRPAPNMYGPVTPVFLWKNWNLKQEAGGQWQWPKIYVSGDNSPFFGKEAHSHLAGLNWAHGTRPGLTGGRRAGGGGSRTGQGSHEGLLDG